MFMHKNILRMGQWKAFGDISKNYKRKVWFWIERTLKRKQLWQNFWKFKNILNASMYFVMIDEMIEYMEKTIIETVD